MNCYKVAIVKTCLGLQQINPCNPNANLFSCIKSRFNLDFVDALACFRSSDGRSQTKKLMREKKNFTPHHRNSWNRLLIPLKGTLNQSWLRYVIQRQTGSPVTQCQVNSHAHTVSIPLENKHPLLCFGFCKKTNISPLQLAIHLVQNCHAGEQESQ